MDSLCKNVLFSTMAVADLGWSKDPGSPNGGEFPRHFHVQDCYNVENSAVQSARESAKLTEKQTLFRQKMNSNEKITDHSADLYYSVHDYENANRWYREGAKLGNRYCRARWKRDY